LLGATASVAAGLPRERHPWGRFAPGSSKIVRVVTQNFAEGALVATESVATTVTTLKQVDDSSVTLEIHSSIEVGGQRVEAAPQTVVQPFHGAESSAVPVVTDLGSEPVTIDDHSYRCNVEQLDVADDETHTIVKTWRSDRVAPFILRRECITRSADAEEESSRTVVEVIAIDQPRSILGRRRRAAELAITFTHAAGKTVTQAWSSMDVPGGIVEHISEERDAHGRVVRRSSLELVSFEAK
jgi:hypothetical protein